MFLFLCDRKVFFIVFFYAGSLVLHRKERSANKGYNCCIPVISGEATME